MATGNAGIAATFELRHPQDNQQAGRGSLPDAAMRRRMEVCSGS